MSTNPRNPAVAGPANFRIDVELHEVLTALPKDRGAPEGEAAASLTLPESIYPRRDRSDEMTLTEYQRLTWGLKQALRGFKGVSGSF